MIGIIGAGITGARLVEQLAGSAPLAILDRNPERAARLAAVHRSTSHPITSVRRNDLFGCEVVVVACAPPHANLTKALVEGGSHVVSMSDDLTDVVAMLNRSRETAARRRTMVVGAAASPGLTSLLVRQVAGSFDSIDEVHVAVHGTGGPNCARQHHRALSGEALGWHDGEWLRRPGGSGRELCWFPEPVGPYDCYRSAMADPIVLRRAYPQLQRISARTSATRRDRLTARLPMLAPPNAEGGMGAVRIEVRGHRGTAREVVVAGVAERLAQIAAVVAASTARQLAAAPESFVPGGQVLGEPVVPNEAILAGAVHAGLRIHRFVGSM